MAVATGRVGDIATLQGFLEGRLSTAGLVTASVAAASCAIGGLADIEAARAAWRALDRAADARTPSSAQRQVSRALGKSLQRLAKHGFVDGLTGGKALLQDEPHQAVALGALCAQVGGTPADAARLAAYQSVSGPASAAVRLLGLDPYAVTELLSRLSGRIDEVAAAAIAAAGSSDDRFDELPAWSAPVLDEDAERHRYAEVRLFAS